MAGRRRGVRRPGPGRRAAGLGIGRETPSRRVECRVPRSRRQGQRAEERSRLLDRFETPEQLLEFLDSEGGERYLRLAAGTSSRTAFVWVSFFGLVSLIGGLATLLMAALGVLDGGQGFLILGGLLLAGGVGILVGAAVAFRLLPSQN